MARIGIVALLLASLLGACSSPSAGATASPPLDHSASLPTTVSALPPDATFPSKVAGLPVLSVASASELMRSGKLDGQAVAVAGYYDQVVMSCPYPGRYIGPLESWCGFVAFTDSREAARLCQPEGSNGVACQAPTGTYLSPFFMGETSGGVGVSTGASQPVALVLIGHAGDPRQWQCTAQTQAECADAFVVDRIAWAEGHDVPVAAPETGDQRSGKPITPRMTLAQVAAAARLGDELLTGAPFRAGDIATVDPRWNLVGDDVVWLVRSLAPATGSDAQGTRREIVWLVDDATGRVIDSHPLKLAADYRPARLWLMATAHGAGCCAGDVLAYYRVQAVDGTMVYDGPVPGGSMGGQGTTTYGGGYGSPPLVLPAGGYSISAWLATNSGGVVGTPRDGCSTQVALRPLDDVSLNADYPSGGVCTVQTAPSPSPGP
jgi:hypothetical protein